MNKCCTIWREVIKGRILSDGSFDSLRRFAQSLLSAVWAVTVLLTLCCQNSFAQLGGTQEVCEGATETYQTAGGGNTWSDYNWSVSGGTIIGGGGSSDDFVTVAWGGPGIASVDLDYNGGSVSESIAVNVDATPIGIADTKVVSSGQITGITIQATDASPDHFDIAVYSVGLIQVGGTVSDGYPKLANEIYDDAWLNVSGAPINVVYTITAASILNACSSTPYTITVTVKPARPVITSFSPLSGPVGTPVTISGNYFDATPSNNSVYFGAIKVTPSAGNTTSLTVAVPPGATSVTPIVVQDITTGFQTSSITSTTPHFTVTLSPAVTPFYKTSKVGVGVNPQVVVAADFNGDGKSDLAVGNVDTGSNDVSILLGDGLGGFAGSTTITVGNQPRGIVTGDFNADGKADFATVNYGSNDLSVKLGDGSGGFTGSSTFSVGSSSIGIATGD
ncbi:MAG TPA: FG-GAP-like repeat-containing protein, partial [Cyclobacteriaceae bacterium]|nr:FG-GAP-like repeat-containing protein [Cyclobacteriaceae bacterium]